MTSNSKPIYKLLNETARSVGIDCNLTKSSPFEEVSDAFENIIGKVDRSTKRKIFLEYKIYITTVLYEKENKEKNSKVTAKDLAEIITASNENSAPQYEDDKVISFNENSLSVNKSLLKFDEGFDREAEDVIHMVNRKHYKLEREKQKKQTKKLKRIIAFLVAAGIIVGGAIYLNQGASDVNTASAISISDEQSDLGEYEMIDYEIKSGDFSKEIIAKRLGTTPDQIEIVGDLSKQAGDIAHIKIYDSYALDNYKYYNEPAVEETYTARIDSGDSLFNIAAEMMVSNPELEEYYFSQPEKNGTPVSILANDLVKQNDIIKDTSTYYPGVIYLNVKFTKAMADKYGIITPVVKN